MEEAKQLQLTGQNGINVWPNASHRMRNEQNRTELQVRLVPKSKLFRIIVAVVSLDRMPFVLPNQQCQSIEGCSNTKKNNTKYEQYGAVIMAQPL